MQSVNIGVGVILANPQGKILICKRKAKHGKDTYSIPGGSLEIGERIKDCAIREVYEETGITIHELEFIGVTNNLSTYKIEGVHSVSLIFYSDNFSGEPYLKEPVKHVFWRWYELKNIPSPQFESSQLAIKILMNRIKNKNITSLIES